MQGHTTQRAMPRFNLASACARQRRPVESVCWSEGLVNRPALFGGIMRFFLARVVSYSTSGDGHDSSRRELGLL
jgi:hypothetical protein